MTTMSHAGKFPTTNSKIHHRNPSWKSILPKHAKSQTYSADSEPLRQFRKLCSRHFFVGFQKFGRLSTFFSHSAPIFLFSVQWKIFRHMAWPFRKSFRLDFLPDLFRLLHIYHIKPYLVYILSLKVCVTYNGHCPLDKCIKG